VNRALTQLSDDMTDARTLRLVRLRVGVFADGIAVGERPQPPRSVHVAAASVDLDASEGVAAYCGAHFAPGTLMEVPWMTVQPHKLCRRRSPILIPAGLNQPRRESGARTVVAVGDTRHDPPVFRDSIVKVTAQWSVHNPIIYVNHTTDSEGVDLAISTYTSDPGSDAVARFELRNPLEVLTASHNLISAGLSLAETLGVDVDHLKSVAPPTWRDRGQFQPNTAIADEELPDS
jgi:hypothetical protein